jgi:hypothetical protein
MASILPTFDNCVNYGRGFFSSARVEQKNSRILKICVRFPESRLVKADQKWFYLGKAVLQG